jgi:glycosyltransferase involved in cell wall biosynthesis
MNPVLISAVIPVYQGEQTLAALVAELEHAAEFWKAVGLPIELVEGIFVDDASRDQSVQVLGELQRRYPWMRVLTLSKNFGQHPATIAGILYSCGDWVVTLDGDLAHHPQHIRPMLAHAISQELDVVYAKPAGTVQHSILRDGSSRLCKRLMAFFTGNPHIREFNSFRLIRGTMARAAASVAGHEPYFDISLCWFTNRIGTYPIALKDRRYIEEKISGYTLWGLLLHARRMLVASEMKWVRFGAIFAVTAMLLSVALADQVLVRMLLDPMEFDGRSWTLLFFAMLFLGGLSSFLIGMLLESFSANTLHLRGRPTFFVADRSKDALLKSLAEEKHTDKAVTLS